MKANKSQTADCTNHTRTQTHFGSIFERTARTFSTKVECTKRVIIIIIMTSRHELSIIENRIDLNRTRNEIVI